MKIIRQILSVTILLIGLTFLSGANAAEGSVISIAWRSNACAHQVIHRRSFASFPMAWWQAEPSTDSNTDDGLYRRLRKRLLFCAIATTGVIAILALLFAYLKMEYVTRGFYSGRLQFLGVALTIVVIAICYLTWLSLGQ